MFALMNKSGGAFSEAQTCRQVIQPVASAVAYLHARGITHRDIKPENLLVNDVNAACKVTDFGFAMDFTQNQCKTRLGTTDYMAPEIVRCDKAMRDRLRAENRSGYGPEVDCWAIGVLAYECLVGAAPFEGAGRRRCTRGSSRESTTSRTGSPLEASTLSRAPWTSTRARGSPPSRCCDTPGLSRTRRRASRAPSRRAGVARRCRAT